jgi:hypothetical protein
MRQHGRKSKAAADVIKFPTAGGHPPPDTLTSEEADIWQDIMGRMPRDWFSVQNLPLLTQYCRHTVRATRIAKMITAHEANPEGSAHQYDALLKMQGRETMALCTLATKMRLSQSAIDETKQGKPTAKASAKPIWEP